MSALVVHELAKSYPTRTTPLAVLRGVSCELSAGENLAILGPQWLWQEHTAPRDRYAGSTDLGHRDVGWAEPLRAVGAGPGWIS